MTVVPHLRDQLIAAAERRQRPTTLQRIRRTRRGLPLLLLLGGAAAGTATAAAVVTGQLGGPPHAAFPRIAAEEQAGMTRTASPRLLGKLQISGAETSLELVGYRMRGYNGRGSILCLDLAAPDGSKSGACSPDLPGRPDGLIGTGPALGTETTAAAPTRLAVGVTRRPVSSPAFTYRLGGNEHTVRAQAVRVSSTLASPLGTDAFTYYAATVPRNAQDVRPDTRTASDVNWPTRSPRR